MRACPTFPLGPAFSRDFSAAPAHATPQLCSNYVCAQSPTYLSLTWTCQFGFLAWPQNCLTAADLLGGHFTVPDLISVSVTVSSDLKLLLCIPPPRWLGQGSCMLYSPAGLLAHLPSQSSWPLLLPESCWVLKAV